MELANNLNNPAVESAQTLPGILISDHYKQAYGYKVHRSGGTKDWLMTYTLSGRGVYTVNQQKVLCQRGDIVILKPGKVHQYETSEDSCWEFLWAHFVPQPAWARLLQLPEPHKGMLHFHVEDSILLERLNIAFQRLLFESRTVGPYAEELSLNAMEEVLLLLAQKHRQNTDRILDPRVEEVLTILTHYLQDQYSITELAKRVNLSSSRLAHLFKEQIGDSIIETRNKIRLRQAARLLEFTTRTIGEIAADVGFMNPFYFTKQFTAFYGKSPTAFREQLVNSQHRMIDR
ncbi:helix-turn-helix domain-containing protein [Neobacillus niacini]|uniref:helix-turn-helix domain-containing protein n=1 Tax=Neobacillus niacini TaxID=86668 RepID=UPI003000C5F4